MIESVLAGLFSPMILFFILGMLTVFVKSDLEMPNTVSFTIALFLMSSIGLRGGGEAISAIMAKPALLGAVLLTGLLAALLGILFTILTAKSIKSFARLSSADAWATGGHYGAVSSATLAVGIAIAMAAQDASEVLVFGGWMAAIYPFMDSPAILTASILGRIAITNEGMSSDKFLSKKDILHKTIFGAAVWILISSLIIGAISVRFSLHEYTRVMEFFDGMFLGILCLFLLDMGMAAAKQVRKLKELGANVIKAIALAFLLPPIWGIVGIIAMYAIHLLMPGVLGWGDAFVFATIAGGCSFISAPAAMRASLPEANPSIYLPMSIALTFPFNIIVSMPIWIAVARVFWGV